MPVIACRDLHLDTSLFLTRLSLVRCAVQVCEHAMYLEEREVSEKCARGPKIALPRVLHPGRRPTGARPAGDLL